MTEHPFTSIKGNDIYMKYGRALTDAEIKSLCDDPYQIFRKPQTPLLYWLTTQWLRVKYFVLRRWKKT